MRLFFLILQMIGEYVNAFTIQKLPSYFDGIWNRMSFLTIWTNYLTTLYILFAVMSMLTHKNSSHENVLSRVSLLNKINHAVCTWQLVITIVFWLVIFPDIDVKLGVEKYNFFYYCFFMEHGPNLVLMLLEGFYCNSAVKFDLFTM